MTMLANAERLMHEAIVAALQPPPPVDYLKWAVENVVFTKRETQEPGPYNASRFSYFNEILLALNPSDPCRVVTLMKSAQLGGTVLANVFTAGSMDMDPGDLMYAHPTENNAQRWSKMKLRPLLRSTAALCKIFPERSRDGGDSTLYKERADGLGAILISGANSPATLSQVTMPRQVQDDLAKWENNSAGNPETQADSRSRGVAFAKIFKISTPLVEPGCRITKAYEAGTQERCYVPCPHCEHMQTLEWENMLAGLDEDRPEDAHFSCIDCGGIIEEHHRKWILERHEWRAANPKMRKLHRSFYIWSAYSFLQSWRQIALEWLTAKGDPGAEKTFLNDTVGRAFKAQGEAPPWEGIRDRAEQSGYSRGTIPKGALLLTLGLDCQDDRVEWQLVGWGRNLHRFVVNKGVVPGHVSEPRTQDLLSGLVEQTWPNQFGKQIAIDLAAIDGNAFTEDVWSWAQKHRTTRVIMVRGRGEDWAPLFARVKKERNKAGVLTRYSSRFYNFGTSTLKSALYRHLLKADPEASGYVAFPEGLEDDYFQQLTSEHRTEVKKLGQTVYRWEKIDKNQPNEMLDTMLQAEAAAIKLGLRSISDAVWSRFEAEREGSSDMPVPVERSAVAVPRSPRQQAAAERTQAPVTVTQGRPVGRSPREQAMLDKYGRTAPASPAPAPAPKVVGGWASLLKRT